MTEFSTRSSTTKPLIGQTQSNVPPGQLTSEGDILRLLANYREKPKCNKKGVLPFVAQTLEIKKRSVSFREDVLRNQNMNNVFCTKLR